MAATADSIKSDIDVILNFVKAINQLTPNSTIENGVITLLSSVEQNPTLLSILAGLVNLVGPKAGV